jgi:hypothetical protein
MSGSGAKLFETVVQHCMAEGLVEGTAFAVDASLIAADANKQRSAAGSDDVDWEAIPRTRRSVREYLDTLYEGCLGRGERDGTEVHLQVGSGRTMDRRSQRATEARSALRRAGAKALSSVGHRLATEMESAKPEDRAELWRTVVGPVFRAIWPLDVELQTSASTFKLVQILCTTGEAFPEAAEVILPFIQPDEPGSHTTVYSIAEASDSLYKAAPSKMLDLTAAVVGEALPGSVYALGKALSRLRAIDPNVADTRKFQKLLTYASQHG